MAIAQQMRDLANQAPQGPQLNAQAQAMAQRNARPVTSNPDAFANGIRPQDPTLNPIEAPPAVGVSSNEGLRANPQEALAPRPVPAQAPAAPTASPLPGDAIQAIQASLAARAGRLGSEAQ